MTKRILRFPLDVVDHQRLTIPGLQCVLSVAASRTDPAGVDLWATVDEQAPTIRLDHLDVWIVGTGHPVPVEVDMHMFVDTVVTPSQLVWHVFKRQAG
jgi:hypothetical protein